MIVNAKQRMAALTLAGIAMAVPAQADPLTFDAAIARARATAPQLTASRLGTDAARAARHAAGALPDPKLALGVDSFPISGPLAFAPQRDDFTWVRIGLSQDIPNLAKRHAQQARATTDIAAAEAQVAADERTLVVQTGIAWITLAYAERRLTALAVTIGRVAGLVAATPSAIAGGGARPAQILAGRQSVAILDDRRSELDAAVARARADLARWTGDPRPLIAGTIPDFTVDTAGLRRDLTTNPGLAALAARAGQADADVRLAQAERRPDFGVDVGYQRRDPRFGDYVSAGVTIGLPLFKRNRQEPRIAARLADAARGRADEEAARRALVADFDSGLADHVMHHDQWMRARDMLEPLARQRVDLETASYGAGRAGLVDVVDAHIALADATLQTLDREALVAIDGARLVLTYRSSAR